MTYVVYPMTVALFTSSFEHRVYMGVHVRKNHCLNHDHQYIAFGFDSFPEVSVFDAASGMGEDLLWAPQHFGMGAGVLMENYAFNKLQYKIDLAGDGSIRNFINCFNHRDEYLRSKIFDYAKLLLLDYNIIHEQDSKHQLPESLQQHRFTNKRSISCIDWKYAIEGFFIRI